MTYKRVIQTAVLCMGLVASGMTLAENAAEKNYPDKPVRMIVPFPPGAATDNIARMVAQRLTEKWKQSFIVENRAGATGSIGSAFVAKSAPDGYTLLVATSSSHTMGPNMMAEHTWDPIKDFRPVRLLAWAPNVLVVNPKLNVHSVSELVALLKRSPGKYTFASSGTGSSIQLAGELFKTLAGVDIVHIPYKGAAPAIADLMGGQVDMMFDTVAEALPFIQSKKLTGLAVTTAKRSSSLPEIPTMQEAGVKGYEMAAWIGLMAPADTPAGVVAKLDSAVKEILSDPQIDQKMSKAGLDVPTESRQAFGELIKKELPKYAEIMRAAGLNPTK